MAAVALFLVAVAGYALLVHAFPQYYWTQIDTAVYRDGGSCAEPADDALRAGTRAGEAAVHLHAVRRAAVRCGERCVVRDLAGRAGGAHDRAVAGGGVLLPGTRRAARRPGQGGGGICDRRGGPLARAGCGVRYGEIFLITSQAGQLTAAVYNTTGLNDCPLAAWRSLDPHELAKDFGVAAAYLNGPRFWTLDQIAACAAGEVLSFGGLEARRVAELPIPPGVDLASGPGRRYYRDITIRRQTEWIFAAGRPTYELLTPDGKTYVMQAYSHIVDDSLTLDSLPALGDRLHLPEGWQYRARTPDRDLTLLTAGARRTYSRTNCRTPTCS